MCLAIPVRIEALLPGQRARVTLQGIRREICVALVDDIAVGDYVILHVGYALQKLDEEEAKRTFGFV